MIEKASLALKRLDGNVEVKGVSIEVSGGSEEHIPANWRKSHPCYKVVAGNLAELCLTFGYKIKFGSNELRCLAEDMYPQNIEGMSWFLLANWSKM